MVQSFLISLLYVGFGTLSLYSLYPNSPLYLEWSIAGIIATLPVTIISFGVLYSDSDSELIPIIQTLMLISMWYTLYRWLLRRGK
jgi:hypothetical protein